MLHLIQSNRLERLLDRLREVLAATQDSPLQTREIVVQNPGMARWISQQIARRDGIAANLDFPLPARFIWDIFKSQLNLDDDDKLFSRPVLLWRILAELLESAADPAFREVSGYLAGDLDGRKGFGLARTISDLFDQYLIYRPDMLLQWEAAPGPDWQALLWNRLAGPENRHRAKHFREFAQMAAQGRLDPSRLPRQVCIFGISSLAPVYLEVIRAISAVADVYLFHLNPCREYWADLVSDAETARKRAAAKNGNLPGAELYEAGNPLLASLGKAGREFIGQVHGLDIMEEQELYEAPPRTSLLAHVQRDILDLVDRTARGGEKLPAPEDDRTVQLHSCHGRMREVQVLHDRLLEMFERDPELRPGDILIMAPDIAQYGSAIRTVFDSSGADVHIPWSLADRTIRSQDLPAHSFLSLLELGTGRFNAPDIIAFLETGPVMRRFGIDGESMLTLRKWTAENNIRWGLDLEHRREFNRDPGETHSWTFGMNRLFMGYFTGDRPEPAHGIAPYGPLSSGHALLLGRFATFLDRLRNARAGLATEKSPGQWAGLLLKLLDDFYDPGDSDEEQQAILTIRENIVKLDGDCQEAGFSKAVSLAVIRAWLSETFAQPASAQPFLSGRATFCNMVPMRSVPFAVICLLGMNDADYPRSQARIGFNMMTRQPRPGDRNRRDDDCYLFLEALLSARKTFYVSWLGRDQRDNKPRPPSAVVASLIDYLERSFIDSSGSAMCAPIVEHPLQPFSRKCFDTTPGTASYAGQWLPQPDGGEPHLFLDRPLPEPAGEYRTVDLNQLLRFWSHPVRYFLQQRLDMHMGADEELLDECEPFKPEGLDRYLLANRLLGAHLQGRDQEALFRQLEAEGILPHKNFGKNYFHDLERGVQALLPGVAPLLQEPAESLEIDLAIGPFRLTGWLTGLYAKGCIRYRPAKLKARDMLRLWIEHLALNALDHGYPKTSVFIASDAALTFRPANHPRMELAKLLDLYWQGLSAPLHFYPRTSHAWFVSDPDRRGDAAFKSWNGGFFLKGEGEEPEYRLALQNIEPLGQEFQRLAAAVFGPLFDHLEENDAAV